MITFIKLWNLLVSLLSIRFVEPLKKLDFLCSMMTLSPICSLDHWDWKPVSVMRGLHTVVHCTVFLVQHQNLIPNTIKAVVSAVVIEYTYQLWILLNFHRASSYLGIQLYVMSLDSVQFCWMTVLKKSFKWNFLWAND